MAQRQSELKVYCFYWSNPRLGLTDAMGTIHYFPHKCVVIATSEKEARMMLKARDEKRKKEMRSQMKSHRSDKEIRQHIRNVFCKDGLDVCEFTLRRGLTV